MEILFLWVGLLFACIGALILRFSETEFSGAHVDGEVIGYTPHTDSEGSRSYSPVVAFVHPFAGRRILHSAFGSASFLYPVGARVTVLADRQDPHLARLDTNAFRYFGLVFIATGLGLCVLFFSIFDWSGFSV